MIRFQSHLLSASKCSLTTARGLGCLLSGGSFKSSAKAVDDSMESARKATPVSLNIAFPTADTRSAYRRLGYLSAVFPVGKSAFTSRKSGMDRIGQVK